VIFLSLVILFQSNSTFQDSTNKAIEAGQAAQNTVIEMINGFFARLPLIGVGIIVFLIFLAVAYGSKKLIYATTVKARVDLMLASLISRIGYIIIILLGLFVAASVIFPGVNAGDLFAGLGIGSVALGFAFKDILQNLFAGFLILLYRPFKIGDQIKIDEFEGAVEEITIRATKIKTYDGERVVIPNSDLYMKAVLVRTAFQSRRSKLTVGIGYHDDHEKAREILLEVLKNTEGVLEKPEPDVNVYELADSSVNMRLIYWTKPTQSEVRKTSDRVVSAVKQALDRAGIEIPYPQTVFTMNENKLMEKKVNNKQALQT
jgi:small conductance mechanosensitive channel